MVLAAVLAVTEFFLEEAMPKWMPEVFHIGVAADGLCFWSCLYLGCKASQRQKWLWYHRPRNAQGFATSETGAKNEEMTVKVWAEGLNGGNLPPETKERLLKMDSARHEDLDSVFCSQEVFVNLQFH